MSDGYFSTSYWAGQKVSTGFSPHVMKKPKRTFEKISIQFSSVAQLCPILCHPMDYSMPVLFVHHQLLEFTQMHVHWVGDAIWPSHSLLLSSSPPAFNLSQHQGLFIWVSCLHQWPKYWSFSFSINPSNEYSGLITFQMDLGSPWVQGTLKSLLQHHSSKT